MEGAEPAQGAPPRPTLSDHLARFAMTSEIHAGIDLLDAADMRIAGAWPHVEKSWAEPREPLPQSENEIWSWLWSGVRYDVAVLSVATQMDEASLEGRMASLAARRLIWPDGQVTPWFRILTTGGVRQRVRPAARRPRNEPPEELPS